MIFLYTSLVPSSYYLPNETYPVDPAILILIALVAIILIAIYRKYL